MAMLVWLKQIAERVARPGAPRFWLYVVGAVLLAWGIMALTGCASANDKAGEAALVGGGAAAGAAAGGPLWAGIVAAAVSFWNWLGGAPEAAGVLELGLFGRIGVFIDSALIWCAVGLLALWLIFPRTRGALIDFIAGFVRAPVAALRGDSTLAKEAAKDIVLAPARLVGVVGESRERRVAREAMGVLNRASRKSRSRAE